MIKPKVPGKPKPAGGPIVDRVAAQEHHLNVLKRIDSEIEETRKNVEGSLFLVKRKTNPRFQMLILNKVSTGDYVETIDGELGFEVQPDSRFLMYTHGNDEILGVWFYDAEDLERVSSLLNRVIAQLPKRSETDTSIQEQETAFFRVDNKEGASTAPPSQAVNLSVESAQDLQRLMMSTAASPASQDSTAPANNLAMKLMKAHQEHQKAKQPQSPMAPAARPAAPPPAAAADLPQGLPQATPPSKTPQLMTPDVLFKLAAGAAAGSQGSAPDASANGGDHLKNLLAKAVKPLAAKPSEHLGLQSAQSLPAPLPALNSVEAAPTMLPPSLPAVPAVVRDRVRQAFSNLLANDAFVDMLASEFTQAGLLQ